MSLPPLPTGWDRDRVYSTNEIDRADLPAADQELISAWRKADAELSMANLRATVAAHTDSVNASRVAAGLPTLQDAQTAMAEDISLPHLDMATQSALFDVATAMQRMGAEAWGFVVFKTWGYKDAERARWDAFWRTWNELMDRSLRDLGAVGDLQEGFTGRLLWWLVDHESMDGKGINEVRDCFAQLVDEPEEHIPLGLDLDLCLMIDKESVDSLLDGEEPSSASQLPEEKEEKAFVFGVDVNYHNADDDDDDDDDEEGAGEGGEDDEYPGHFKISVSVLIPELWHTLDTQTPDELYPGKGQIYGGIVGTFAEAIATS